MGIERGRDLSKRSLSPRPLVQSERPEERRRAASAEGAPALSFRRAAAADIGALVELRIEFMRIVKDSGLADEGGWRAGLAALFGRELSSEALLVWVAEAEGRIVGTSGLRLPRRGQVPVGGEILNMFTVPVLRRRGVGSELLRLAIAEARARGLPRLRLQPTDDGRPLYERAGFRDEGRGMVLDLD